MGVACLDLELTLLLIYLVHVQRGWPLCVGGGGGYLNFETKRWCAIEYIQHNFDSEWLISSFLTRGNLVESVHTCTKATLRKQQICQKKTDNLFPMLHCRVVHLFDKKCLQK